MTALSGIRMTRRQYAYLMAELFRRGGGYRESGAFLLAESNNEAASQKIGWIPVSTFAFYDDLDQDSLTGAIAFGAAGYSALGALCRSSNLRVVGDIHTHPGKWVNQSPIDAANPMVAMRGHVAIIAPNFAQTHVTLRDLGVHVFQGSGAWESYFKDDVRAVLRIASFANARFATWCVLRQLSRLAWNFRQALQVRKNR